MYKQKHFLWLAGFSLLCMCIYSCKEEKNGPLPNAGRQPVQVSNVLVQNLNGGALLTYTLPKNGNVRYVEAEWSVHGITHTTKASVYTDTLMVQGFGDTLEHEIKLYSVNPGEKKSAPVAVTIKPLRAPVNLIMDSLSVRPDWGGITATFVNRTKASIMISVLTRDSVTGKLKTVDTHSTNLAKDSISIKGYPPVKKEFGFYVKDQWNNFSDTIYKELTPFFETELDINKFKEVDLPTDMQNVFWNFSDLWNADAAANIGGFHSPNDGDIPGWFTMDLGVKAKLSRFKMWGLTDGREYTGGHVKHFQIWGSLTPASNGSWNGWTLLQDCTVVKPSGLPSGQLSNEDIEYAESGFEFKIPKDAPTVQFIRIKVLGTFSLPEGGMGAFWVKRLAFWGSPKP